MISLTKYKGIPMKPLILFHGKCTDGFTAAWVAWKAFNHKADIQACNYGDPVPDVTDRDVYILDFSFPRAVLEEMYAKAKSILVLDHHKTAEEALRGLPYCQFDMTRSGARMAWDYFFPNQQVPVLVAYVEDRDLWRWALQGSRAVSAFTHSVKRDLATWDGLVTLSAEEMAWRGEAILAYQETQVDYLVKNAREVEIGGYKVLAVNSPVLQSEIGEKLAQGRPFGAVWFEREDGARVWSLRSRPPTGVDVSEVAKKLGGGGHAQASGFTQKGDQS
jgi:uncharacterized protein